jgi:ACT domain
MRRTVVVRVWLPDRPGALGQVASRIGAVRGDVTSIDILERGGGRVVDELVVAIADTTSEELLANEIGAVDGVSVEHIRPIGDERSDSATAMLTLAARLAEIAPAQRLATLIDGLAAAVDADWAVAVQSGEFVQRCGDPPEAGWLVAFLEGSEHLDAAHPSIAIRDLVWARLPRSRLVIAAGRARRPVHERERSRVGLLSVIADALL